MHVCAAWVEGATERAHPKKQQLQESTHRQQICDANQTKILNQKYCHLKTILTGPVKQMKPKYQMYTDQEKTPKKIVRQPLFDRPGQTVVQYSSKYEYVQF